MLGKYTATRSSWVIYIFFVLQEPANLTSQPLAWEVVDSWNLGHVKKSMMWMKKPGLKLPNFTKTKTTWKVSVAVAIPTVHVLLDHGYLTSRLTAFVTFWEWRNAPSTFTTVCNRSCIHGTNPVYLPYTCYLLIYHRKNKLHVQYRGALKPILLEVFMVNNLVFRWPKPLFFMVLGGSW